jgi:tRNA threonylcarbamoyl adenosine modification protein YeaZ
MTGRPGGWHLGLDTATPWLSLALWRPDDDAVLRRQVRLDRALARAVMGELDAFLTANDVTLRQVAAVGVGVGPGSFTGIRIGVAAAVGLGRGLDLPVGGAGTLHALALAGLADGERGWALLDARRGAVYAGRFARHGDDVVVLDDVRRRPREEVPTDERVVEGVAPDALHAARRALAGEPPHPRYG